MMMASDQTQPIVGSSWDICRSAEPRCNVQKIEASVAVDVHLFGVRHAGELLRSDVHKTLIPCCFCCGRAIRHGPCIYHPNLDRTSTILSMCQYVSVFRSAASTVIIYSSLTLTLLSTHLWADRGCTPRCIWKFHPRRIETQRAHLESCRVTSVS